MQTYISHVTKSLYTYYVYMWSLKIDSAYFDMYFEWTEKTFLHSYLHPQRNAKYATDLTSNRGMDSLESLIWELRYKK